MKIFWVIFVFQILFLNRAEGSFCEYVKNIVNSTFKIELNEFSGGWNPSIFKIDEGFILSFRYLPDPERAPYISYIGVVILDNTFKQISSAELLDLRKNNLSIPSQVEDARIFCYKNDLYLIYNDNPNIMNPLRSDRRDMYIVKLSYSLNKKMWENGVFSHFHSNPSTKLIYPKRYLCQNWEKNWVPFVVNNDLFIAYSINPHEILSVDLETGICSLKYSTEFVNSWNWGDIRGGTPAAFIDGEYLAFFHSSVYLCSGACNFNQNLLHYFMGAYTFSAYPPFNVTKISSIPINHKSFYTKSNHPKRVIFPCGYTIFGEDIYISYGKDDAEMWIAVINAKNLFKSLQLIH